MNLPELISPERADQLVLFAAIALSLIGAITGFWAAKTRGLMLVLGGPLVFLLWQGHKWITRYDPDTQFFGLDKVWVLGLEVVVFLSLGATCGWIWNRVISPKK